MTTNPDIEKWNKKFTEGNAKIDYIPDDFLVKNMHFFPPKSKVLDLACGAGCNALYLAKCGYKVDALDGSHIALGFLKKEAEKNQVHINIIETDLDKYKLPNNYYDVIVIARFLKRHLFNDIINACKPGGIIFYASFNMHRLNEKPSFNKDFLLNFGELPTLFPSFSILATNDSHDVEDTIVWVVAKKKCAC